MYMSSEISGQVQADREAKLGEEQTFIKKMFASLDYVARVPEIDSLCVRIPNSSSDGSTGEDAGSQIRFIEMPSECQSQIERTLTEKRAESAFFERRPRKQKDFTDKGSKRSSVS